MLVLLGSLALTAAARADGAAPAGRVVKVLPLFLNLKGHDALSPSLFDRDAYQFYLRQHTNEVSGMRFDVLWKAPGVVGTSANLKIQIELRSVAANGDPVLKTLEKNVTPHHSEHWTSVPLTTADYRQLGDVVAWRATLWDGDQLLSQQQSFLW